VKRRFEDSNIRLLTFFHISLLGVLRSKGVECDYEAGSKVEIS